jgi:hypothetical protein
MLTAVHIASCDGQIDARVALLPGHPVGPQIVRLRTPDGVRIRRVELLRDSHEAPFNLDGQSVQFTVPRVVDYEIAGIYTD